MIDKTKLRDKVAFIENNLRPGGGHFLTKLSFFPH